MVKNSERDGNTRPPYLPPEKPVSGQEATARATPGKMNWIQIGKGVCQGCILPPRLFNFYEEYIMQNAAWMNHKLESRLLGEISTTSDMQMKPL